MGGVSPEQAELELLIELASGGKTFTQVQKDAHRLGLESLDHSNPSRVITERLRQLTGVSKESLSFFPVKCNPDSATEVGGECMRHPFVLISTIVEKVLQNDEYYFEVEIAPQADGIVASSFTRSPEYLGHPLVQECSVRGETVVPISLYSDGVKVCCDSHPDTLYGIYVNFIHRDADECTKKANKHVVTVYRKSDVCDETLTDIWNIILWDLKALAVGCKPRLGEEVKPLEEQVPDEPLGGMWGVWHKVCLMQIRGDWAWYCEALGAWQWNCKSYMCPFCRARRDGRLTWKNFSLQAPWLATCRTHRRFLRDMERSRRSGFRRGLSPFAFESRILQAPFFAWTMIKLDWMHAVDIGVLVYVLGEVWWSLLLHLGSHVGGRNLLKKRLAGVRALKARIKKHYADHHVNSRIPLRRFKLTKIKSGRTGPKLKVKAAQARKLLPLTMQLVAEFRDVDGALGENRFQCVRHLCQIYELSNQRELSDADLTNWRQLASTFMYFYVSCGFRVYPKHHYFFHFPEQIARTGVPRDFWTYSDESKNFQLKRIFEVCGGRASSCQQVLLHLEWLFRLEHLLEDV